MRSRRSARSGPQVGELVAGIVAAVPPVIGEGAGGTVVTSLVLAVRVSFHRSSLLVDYVLMRVPVLAGLRGGDGFPV